MSSIGIRLPINYDSNDGFQMLKTFRETIKQNLKMLVLTNPGERIMEPDFGVGVQRYLFSNFSENIQAELNQRIHEQVADYIPAVSITDIGFTLISPDTNSISFQIFYTIPDVGLNDLLEFTI